MADKTTGPTVYTALIMPLSSHATFPKPTPPGGQPPYPDQGLPGDLPHPEHPIFFPLPPGAPVDPSYGIPIDGPYPDQGLPGSQPHPDQGLPGQQPKPDQGLPPFPSHPIVLPPGNGGWLPVYIDNTLPGSQPKPDQGLPPFPSNPIVLPPDGPAPPEAGSGAQIKFKAIWTPSNGWQTIGVIVPGGEHVTPSKKK